MKQNSLGIEDDAKARVSDTEAQIDILDIGAQQRIKSVEILKQLSLDNHYSTGHTTHFPRRLSHEQIIFGW